MKNYDSKFSPFLGAGILGVTTPVSVYLIGFLAELFLVVATVIFLPFVWNGVDKLINIISICSLVLQILAVVIFTLIVSAFSDVKIIHLLISAATAGVLFFIVERFIPKIRWINVAWQAVIFPKLLLKRIDVRFDGLNTKQFVELHMYLPTALILTGTFFAVSLITWGIYRAASHNKNPKTEL